MPNPSEIGHSSIDDNEHLQVMEDETVDHGQEPADSREQAALFEKSEQLKMTLKEVLQNALTNLSHRSGMDGAEVDILVKNDPSTSFKTMHFKGVDIDGETAFLIRAKLLIPSVNGPPQEIVYLSRNVFFDKAASEWKVFRGGISVSPKFQGKGIASKLSEIEEKSYVENGITEVLLKAGHDVGTYYNAQQGFDFAFDDQRHEINAKMLSFVIKKGIQDVRIKGQQENVYPFKREFTAQELSQMKAYDHSGAEIMFSILQEAPGDNKSVSDKYLDREYSLGKAFFLDRGSDAALLHGWFGKKRLA